MPYLPSNLPKIIKSLYYIKISSKLKKASAPFYADGDADGYTHDVADGYGDASVDVDADADADDDGNGDLNLKMFRKEAGHSETSSPGKSSLSSSQGN